MTNLVLAILLTFVCAWESVKLFAEWKQQVSVFAGIRYSRNECPKRFWFLTAMHGSFLIFIVAVLSSLFSEITP